MNINDAGTVGSLSLKSTPDSKPRPNLDLHFKTGGIWVDTN